MENGGNGFTNGLRGQNSSNGNQSWDFWELGTSRFDWSTSFNEESTATAATAEAAAQALVFFHQGEEDNGHQQYQTLYSGGSHAHPDPHLTSLKLGKRHYFEDGGAPLGERHVPGFPIGKRVRSYGVGGGASSSSTYSSASAVAGMVSAVAVPKCQVEGCHVPLVNVKDYHRRHKVCEMHSKAPRVVVLGIEQRFCQQCSRFHVVSEFDDSKRSCRRRLAGHNERRRKNSNDSITRNPSQESKSIGGRFSCIASSSRRALSLLSARSASSVSPSDASDLSSQSSAALRELIAENRAAVLTRQLFSDRAWHCHSMDELGGAQPALISHIPHHQLFPEPLEWGRFHESGTHVTLDLMQAPSSPFGFMSGRHKSKEEEEECCEIWKSLEGTPVV